MTTLIKPLEKTAKLMPSSSVSAKSRAKARSLSIKYFTTIFSLHLSNMQLQEDIFSIQLLSSLKDLPEAHVTHGQGGSKNL